MEQFCGTSCRLRYGDIELDTATGAVFRAGCPVPLSPKEAALLAVFLASPGRALTRDALLVEVWGAPAGLRTRTVDIHIHHLRQKLHLEKRLTTVFGVGYRLEPAGPAEAGGERTAPPAAGPKKPGRGK